MQIFNTNTDWKRNKDSESIIYPNADGSTTEIILQAFLAEDDRHTEEQFQFFKEESDNEKCRRYRKGSI